jgi:hypothetical protein
MASPAFYNENESRAYPFVAATSGLPPKQLVVDAGFVAGPKSRFETGDHTIWLSAVRRQGSYFYFDFRSDAPELFGLNLTFSRHVNDGDFALEFVDSGTAGLSASSLSGSDDDLPQECDEPLWSGFLVTGRMAALIDLLPTDGELSYEAYVEPALRQNLAESFVVKMAVANDDRTRVQPADGCGEVSDTGAVTYVKANCVVGEIVFVAGYNANVRQSTTDNSITLGAAVGDGAGEPCDSVPLYEGESPPPGSTLREGGPRCNETIRSVNGIGGPQLNLIAGRGVTITGSPEDNRVIVNVNMSGLALCFDSISARSESC